MIIGLSYLYMHGIRPGVYPTRMDANHICNCIFSINHIKKLKTDMPYLVQAATTNYHTLSGFKITEIYFSQF